MDASNGIYSPNDSANPRVKDSLATTEGKATDGNWIYFDLPKSLTNNRNVG